MDVMATAVPPGWPAAVRPPGEPDWERGAVGWLLDACPPESRSHQVLRRYPVALAWLARRHAEAAELGCRRATAQARAELGGVLSPEVVERFLQALELEQVRLLAASRAVALVEAALRGERYVPRL